MKEALLAAAMITLATPMVGEPADMTGMYCKQINNYGQLTWEFFGDVAIRYYDGDPFDSVDRMPRVGLGAYERYGRDGKWSAVYYFFDAGDGLKMRIVATPGLMVREENPKAPIESGVAPFVGTCKPLWETE